MHDCRRKLAELQETGDGISQRASELEARPQAISLARKVVDLTKQQVKSWASDKPWINTTDSDNLLSEVKLNPLNGASDQAMTAMTWSLTEVT